MSLPPQILRIKRKRDDEPVDSLYIETSRADSKRRHTQHDYVFRRLIDNEVQPHIPSLSSTGNGPAGLAHQNAQESSVATQHLSKELGKKHIEPANNGTGDKTVIGAAAEPRRFLLTRPSVADQVPKAPAKRRNSHYDDTKIAIFVESVDGPGREARPLKAIRLQHSEDGAPGQLRTATPSPSRKRPGARSSPMKVTKPSTTPRTTNFEAAYAAMQQFAEDLDTSQHLRGEDSAAKGEEMMDTGEDYIYDTYIRYSAAAEEPNSPESAKGPVGVLVIREVDQPLWETYYDSDAHSSDEQDWDSEQDDENAENYYGADYPEDEVDSLDEQDEDPYRFRRGASDDEEFGSEDEAWSDEEHTGAESWIDVTGFEARTGRRAMPMNHADEE